MGQFAREGGSDGTQASRAGRDCREAAAGRGFDEPGPVDRKRCSAALLALSGKSVGVGRPPHPGHDFVETVLWPTIHQAG